MKGNLSKKPPGLIFRITDSDTPRVEWRGETDLTADELLRSQSSGRSGPTEKEKAKEFLLELMEELPLAFTEVKARAEEAGISFETLKKIRKECGVESQRNGSSYLWVTKK